MRELYNLIAFVIQWGAARNITTMESLDRQFMKLVSEIGEVATAYLRSDKELLKDGVGDTFVVLILLSRICGFDISTAGKKDRLAFPSGLVLESAMETIGLLSDAVAKRQFDKVEELSKYLLVHLNVIAASNGLNLQDCLQFAYEEIKDRKGVMYGGTFVKSTDERYASIMEELGLPA